MNLKDLLEEISVLQFIGNRDEEIQGISYSSKTVRSGYLFAALKGEKSDGFNFTGEALTNGAAAVLSDRPMPADFKKTWIQVSDARKTLALCSANFYSHPSKKMKNNDHLFARRNNQNSRFSSRGHRHNILSMAKHENSGSKNHPRSS